MASAKKNTAMLTETLLTRLRANLAQVPGRHKAPVMEKTSKRMEPAMSESSKQDPVSAAVIPASSSVTVEAPPVSPDTLKNQLQQWQAAQCRACNDAIAAALKQYSCRLSIIETRIDGSAPQYTVRAVPQG